MLVLNAEVLFVDSLVFLHVVSVVRGRSSRGVHPSTVTASLNADFIPDDEAPALMISLELALAAQAPVHDKVQAPSSAPPQPGPPDSPDSGASTAQ